MRRGLMGWNAEELPVATLEARLARLRAAMAKAGMDAFVIYTNNTRPSAVAYVTGFTPYWSDALMLVPQTGAPVFATALSKRVSEWIRTTDPLSEIVNTPKPGALIGERLAKDRSVKRVGVLEYDSLVIRLTARSSRRRIPPENCAIGLSAASSRPNCSSRRLPVARAAAERRP